MPHAPIRPRRFMSSKARDHLVHVQAPRRREARRADRCGARTRSRRHRCCCAGSTRRRDRGASPRDSRRATPRAWRRPSPAAGSPSWHLVVMRTPAGSAPSKADAITASHTPYMGAVSSRLIPASSAAWTVATASVSVDAPHPNPSPPPPRVSRLTLSKGPSVEYRMRSAPLVGQGSGSGHLVAARDLPTSARLRP